VRGGRSARYDERHHQRGHERSWAPSWSDATAAAVLQMLESAAMAATGSKQLQKKKVARMLGSTEGSRLLISCSGSDLVPADRQLVADIVTKYHQAVAACFAAGDNDKALRKAHAFLKPLYARRAARSEIQLLEVPPATSGPATFHAWIGPGIQGEKLRDFDKSQRTAEGLDKWPLGWLNEVGVVCYERAAGRIRRERPGSDGVPDGEFVKGLVKTKELATAVANPADHYVVIEPGGAMRYMRTSEVATRLHDPGEQRTHVSVTRTTAAGSAMPRL